jgi:ankyrin repeat protein
MVRSLVVLGCVLARAAGLASDEKAAVYPKFGYDVAQAHEIKPHRRTVPVRGAQGGFNHLTVTVTVSATGDVIKAEARGDDASMRFWPKVEGEVNQWRFTPFERDGKAMAVEYEEYVDLVPPERFPKVHVAAPAVRPDSKVAIALERTACFGSCPGYTVTVETGGIVFEGGSFVVAAGRHTDKADASEVRELAKRFVAADFYSMDAEYAAGVTDNPTYVLRIAIDGKQKQVVDYVGSWVGMPEVVTELEDAVDEFARTKRWIKGDEGLVSALKAENYNFQSYDAQVMLKEASTRGEAGTVQELLAAGVPLKPFAAPKPKDAYTEVPFEHVGWLAAAGGSVETLKVLIGAGASKDDQNDKDLALANAARAGSIDAVRALIADGANPNADLSKSTVTEGGGGMTIQGQGAGSVLIYAAESGNPAVVREILSYHPKLEAKDREGKTAIFYAGEYRYNDEDGARVECVKLLAEAGANVNAQDNRGDTPLHGIFLTDVEEELLKLGANVNARNNEGETPIFTNVDNDCVLLFLRHGANLSIRSKKGETVAEAAERQGPLRVEALQKAIAAMKQQ